MFKKGIAIARDVLNDLNDNIFNVILEDPNLANE